MKNGLTKKIFTGILISIMAIGFTGCGAKEDVYDKIIKNGELVVGMSADYAPYEYHALIDGKKQIVGFDVDIAQAIADDLGVKLKLVEMDFDSLCNSVKQGKLDMAISGMTPKPDRKKAVDFSDIYYKADQAFLIQSKDKDTYKTLDDLKGKKIGAQMGTIQAEIANDIEGANVKLLTDVNTLILELKNGNIDALIIEVPVATLAANTNPDLYVPEEYIKDEEGGSAIGMPKNSPKLVEAVNKTLNKLMDEGKIDEYVQKAVENVQFQSENNE